MSEDESSEETRANFLPDLPEHEDSVHPLLASNERRNLDTAHFGDDGSKIFKSIGSSIPYGSKQSELKLEASS